MTHMEMTIIFQLQTQLAITYHLLVRQILSGFVDKGCHKLL